MSGHEQTFNEIWAGDHLGRRDEANYLSGYLAARYQSKAEEAGFVLAVNGDWGMGKTFMLERWGKEMQLAGHPVVLFNSWENDFTPEPLVAFIAELDAALGPYFEQMPMGAKLRAKWYAQAKAVLVPSLKIAGFALAKHVAGIGSAQMSELLHGDNDIDTNEGAADEESKEFDVKDLAEKLSKAVDETLKSHASTKKAIQIFKDRLALLIEHLSKEPGVHLPVCVFIDELDRCRPDYAIRLLEGIKHLFGVPGLHFVVATNLTELAHSVRAVYGSGFSAERYLKRFFDMEYSLPEPDGHKFAIELMAPIADLTNGRLVTGLESVLNFHELPAKGLPYMFSRHAAAFGLQLRDQQQAARILETALISLGSQEIHIQLLMFLAVLYQKNSQVYHQVAKAKNLSESTGFQAIFTQNEEGFFSVPQNDGSRTRKSVSLRDIAGVYFGLLNNYRSNSYVGGDDFPANLENYLGHSKKAEEMIRSYIEIIRRAGRFSK